jgi:uncharacterized protein DUF2877
MSALKSTNTLSLVPDVNRWLANSRQPRILHIFDRTCNLINEHGEVLSIVTPQIGNGPFNLVVEDEVLFSNCLTLESQIAISANRLILGNLTIYTADSKLWSPRPDWEKLHAHQDPVLNQLTQLPMINDQPSLPISLLSTLATSIAIADLSASLTAAQKLTGLGIGLTPAGDDFILGAILAARIIHPIEIASVLAEGIANTCAPLTTSLSAAWLRSAGRGDAGILWHQFFEALTSSSPVEIQTAMDRILAIGETSGADALAGFIGTLIEWGN